MLRRFTFPSTASSSASTFILTASAFSFRQKCCKEDPQKATVASVLGPAPYKVKMGRKYYWCSCGESKKQPFCDGSHKKFNELQKTDFHPVEYVNNATEDMMVSFCTCKQTKTQPLCDGSHNDIDT
jgi:CDGSH-type Zn-finger protein